MVGIIERVAKINGLIPDRSLVTVGQRAFYIDHGEVTFNIEAASGNMAKMMYGPRRMRSVTATTLRLNTPVFKA